MRQKGASHDRDPFLGEVPGREISDRHLATTSGHSRVRSSAQGLQDCWQEQIVQVTAKCRQGESGMAVARAMTAAVEAVVLKVYDRLADSKPERHALVAVGGFGRREMALHSDVDLLFLFARERDKRPELICGMLHPLWDLHFEVGHSCCTTAEALLLARAEMNSCTAMMDSRLLDGDRELFDGFQHRLFNHLPAKLLGKLHQWRRRRLDNSDSVQLLEPNVKESPGGLRDLQSLEWAFKVLAGGPDTGPLWRRHLEPQELERLVAGRDFLWQVRHQLHYSTGRKRDLLEHELKPAVAQALGYEDCGQEMAVERFMHQYYLHARCIYHLSEMVFDRLTTRKRLGFKQRLLECGVWEVDGEIALDQADRYFAEDPLRLLRIFHLAQVEKLTLGEATQRSIRAGIALIDDELRADSEARELFLCILRQRCRVAASLRLMHELGVLGAYLPEFKALTCLVQYDSYHLYTVDEHTLVAIENLEALGRPQNQSPLTQVFARYKRRDLLYLAVLLHDVGKAQRQDHLACGVKLARELCRRVALTEADCNFLLFQIERHQEMVILSQRRDLDDYRMVAEFASSFPDMEWLQALYLLSYADLSAVSPEAWSAWPAALLAELYHKASEQLESGIKTLEQRQQGRQLLDEHLKAVNGRWSPARALAFQEHVERLPPRYLLAYSRTAIERHLQLIERLTPGSLLVVEFVEQPSYTELLVCTRDQRQLLAKICGALAVNDLNILRAEVNTRDDRLVLDSFQLTDVDGCPALSAEKKARVSRRLEEVIALKLKARELLERYRVPWERRKRRWQASAQPPRVGLENQVSDRYTVIDVEVQDDVGLLYKITHCLSELGLDIHMAIVNTVAHRAQDAFYVVDGGGEKIVNYQILEEIRQTLFDALAR